MEQSNIMQNVNFLRVLRQANRSRQRTMIPSASDRQILALCDVWLTCCMDMFRSYLAIALISDVGGLL